MRVGEDVEEREHTGQECAGFATETAIQGKSSADVMRWRRLKRRMKNAKEVGKGDGQEIGGYESLGRLLCRM